MSEIVVAPTEQFFVQQAPSIRDAIEARDAEERPKLTFTYLTGPRGQEVPEDIRGICLGVRQASERNEASYWIFLQTDTGHVLITYNPLDAILQHQPFTLEQWTRLLKQTDFRE